MSVVKAKRNQNDFKVVTQAIEIRKDLAIYILRDFAVDGKLDYMDQWFLNDERTTILHYARDGFGCIEMANSIYITNMKEYEERRIWQDRAIGYYNRLIQELEFIIRSMTKKININKYTIMIDTISKEIGLISNWRKSDNKIKNKLINNIG